MTLLPPGIPHDGRAATPGGFRKRVLYLTDAVLGADLVGPAVDRPALADTVLRRRVHELHGALARPGDELEARSRLALVGDRLTAHLRRADPRSPVHGDPGLAGRLRDLLDARTTEGLGLGLDEAAALLHAHPTHLVRAFTREFGCPPHRYLTGRRVDLARRLLLAGMPPVEVANAAGFHDQSHLSRHFRRTLGTTPGRFAGRRSPDG